MMKNEIHRKLLNDANKIYKKFEVTKMESGLDMNIFTLLDIEKAEQYVHENMIYAILNFKPEKKIAERFVKCFLEIIGLPKAFIKQEWEVEHQYFTSSYGIMDIFMKTKGKNKKCIVIELKIDALDQKRQLERYCDYVKQCNYNDYRILYLTLDGRSASKQSIGNVQRRKIKNISFRDDICCWLECCLNICKEEEIDTSFIKQYAILVNKLTGENDMNEEICNLIKNSDDLRAGIEISNSLSKIKTEILYDFLSAINRELQRKGFKNVCDEEELEQAKEYYSGKSVIPYMGYVIKEYIIRGNKKLNLVLGIEVDYSLYYYFGFHVDGNWAESNDIKKSQKRIYQKIVNEIESMLNIQIRENNYTSIYYQHINDLHGQKYDFKHFSDNCADLKEKKILNSEARRIAREMVEYINCLKDTL